MNDKLTLLNRELARRSLGEWSKFTNPDYIIAPFHRRLLAALERVERGECKRLIVSMPPRMGKTEAVSVNLPAWFLGRNPDKRVILSSYGASLAYINSRKARNLLNAFGADVFGVKVASDSAAVDEWSVEGHRGGLAAVGVDGPATGKGADLAIIDDPIKDMKEALSEVVRSNVKEWYKSVLRTRLHPGGSIIVLQTRWHEDDLTGWLLEEARAGGEQWETLVLPMVNDDGQMLWPGRYSRAEVDAIRTAVGSTVWQALYQQTPTAQEGGMFKRHFWRFWSHSPGFSGSRPRGCSLLPSVELPKRFDHVIVSVDAAFKGTADSDAVSITSWGAQKANRFLIRRVNKQLTFTQTLAVLRGEVAALKAAGYRTVKVIVEDKANGSAIIDTLSEELGGIVPVNPEGGKESRAAAMQPLIEGGNIFLPEEDPGVEQYINEHASFPKGKHDDDVDSTSQAMLYLREHTGLRVARGISNL